jgi:DNA-binding MarR family transcriptional regulator
MDAARFSSAWDEFFAAVRRARGRAAQRTQPGMLTLAQFQLLAAFGNERELSVGEVALAGGVTPPSATRMLANLERDGIVERHHSDVDRRSTRIRLTGKGRRLLARKRDLVLAKQREIYESLTTAERRQAETILRRLAVAMEDL